MLRDGRGRGAIAESTQCISEPVGLCGGAAQCNGTHDQGTTLVANTPHPVKVEGVRGVPTNGVSAVVLNVTVTGPSAPGYLTAYPAGESATMASNVNVTANETVPNRVIIPVSSTGEIDLDADVSTNAIADVTGWLSAAFGTGSTFTPETSPVRICDTRPRPDIPSELSGTAAQCNGTYYAGKTLSTGKKLTLVVAGRHVCASSGSSEGVSPMVRHSGRPLRAGRRTPRWRLG